MTGAADDEACGLVFKGRNGDGAAALSARRQTLADAERRRSIAVLRGRPDELSQAVARLLDIGPAGRDELARLASTTRDARVYALAFHACDAQGEGACQLLSAAQWARLDPGNAVPWLYAAAEAGRQGDAASFDEAMRHAGSASTADMGEGIALLALPEPEATPEAQVGQAELASQLAGQAAAWTLDLRAGGYCRGANGAPAGPERLEICNGLAEVLANRSTSLVDRQIGIALGARLGWPAERVERMTAELQLVMEAFQADVAEATARPGCDAVLGSLQGMRERAALGPYAAAHRRLEGSGGDVERQVARRIAAMRAETERRRRQGAASASG
jgi:hypothetical protein